MPKYILNYELPHVTFHISFNDDDCGLYRCWKNGGVFDSTHSLSEAKKSIFRTAKSGLKFKIESHKEELRLLQVTDGKIKKELDLYNFIVALT